ncbi:MAG: hypothetical protein ACRDDF_11150, partial [Aeromonas sp.]
VTSFHKELNKKLIDLKVIRDITIQPGITYIPTAVKRAIAYKRKIDDLVSKRMASLENLEAAKCNLKAAIRAAKRKTYIRYIKKGIKFLSSNDQKNSCKWNKEHSGISRNSLAAGPIYKPKSTDVESAAEEALRIWASHFEALSLPYSSDSIVQVDKAKINKFSRITDIPITWEEISVTIKSLRNGKAIGLDKIPGEVYKIVASDKECKSNLAKSILSITNGVFNNTKFPEECNDCIIVPIHKKGDRMDPNNYRGIALINTLFKILAKIIA